MIQSIKNIFKKYFRVIKTFGIQYQKYIKEAMKYIIAILLLIYCTVSYYSEIMSWYDINVMPIIAQIKSNIWFMLLTFSSMLIILYQLMSKWKVRYQFNSWHILFLIYTVIVLSVNRFSGDYNYISFIGVVTYVDLIYFSIFLFVVLAIINKKRILFPKEENDRQDINENLLLHDNPIVSIDEDIFDFKDEINKLLEYIQTLDKRKTWSIAILAKWGIGKTSFMNILYEGLKTKDLEILHFNPRDSKNYKNIQEDFFVLLSCCLSKYNAKCSNTMKKYMSALQLIDTRWGIEKFLNLYKIFDKEELKDRIKETFASLQNRVVVIIDDFDRLSKEEILEVLKLIDGNAAFTNLTFITAYDKEQVNRALGESYNSNDACFVDKFFNLEYYIPPRPYIYILRFIWKNLCKYMGVDEEEQKEVINIVNNYPQIFKKYIPTIRDAKRYINQVLLDYKYIHGEVVIKEFLLLQLIKYRYPIVYKKLYNKEDYIELSNEFYSEKYLCLKENLNEPEEILSILNILFPRTRIEKIYMHISDNKSFDNYFVNQTYNYIRIRNMQALFNMEWNEIKKIISDWVKKNIYGDLINYLRNLDVDNFRDTEKYFKYSQMVTLLACLRPYTPAYYMFLNLLNEERIMEYRLDVKDYKTKLLDIIKEYDKNYVVLGRIHYSYKTENLDEKDILHDDEIWPEIKSEFLKAAEKNDVNEKDLLEWLYKCVDKNNTLDKTPKLDIECIKAYRSRIEQDPSFYINNFVFLERYSSPVEINGVACENYWRQIFGDEKKIEAFLVKCADKGIKNYDRVSNFWELYKANDYKTIQFNMQGNVQQKIDNNLVDEIKQLKLIKGIEREVSLIPSEIEELSDSEKSENKEQLNYLQKQLRAIKLNISLKDEVESEITDKIFTYKGV